MKSTLFAPLLVALASAAAVQPKVDYDGYKVVRLGVGNKVDVVNNLIDTLSLSSWTGHARENGLIDLVVPPAHVDAFTAATHGMHTEVMHENLGVSIAAEAHYDPFELHTAATNTSWFNSYHSYADHLTWLKSMQSTYSANTEIVVAGNSAGKLPITGIHIFGNSGKGKKPAIILHGTVHAREWIATLVVEYMIYSLLSGYASSSTIQGFVNEFDFYIFPVANPDGFVYSQNSDRLWRKNRVPNSGNSCVGTDINRNWDAFWSTPGGASTDPCDDDYRGVAAADQVETQAHQSFLQKIKSAQTLKAYADFHSYSQLFMTPYGYTCDSTPPNNDAHQTLATAFANALQAVYGTEFTTGPICTTIYQATGSSSDYAYIKASADFSFAAELRDTGSSGFVLPANQIMPSCVETWAGMTALLSGLAKA